MPRHRSEALRPRTLWPAAVQSARRVPLRAAGRRVTPGHAKPSVVPEWRQRLTRSQRRMLERAGHRLLVSPWFAAGAGFVIATGAIIYMPHATLNPAINITHCKLASCKQKQFTPQVGAKPLPAGTGAPILVPGKSSVISGMSFRYLVQERSAEYGFSMLITIHGPRRFDRWNLAFVIPGASGVYVTYGALWRQSGTDGGTAISYASTESAGYAQISAHESGDEVVASRTGYTVTFQVRGNGTPGPPTDCYYDGVRCHFRQAPDPSNWSSYG